MPSHTTRNLELIRLGPPLRRFASGLQPDPNAASWLVHRALAGAFAEPPDWRRSDELEASLRGDIAQLFAIQAQPFAAQAMSPRDADRPAGPAGER